MLPRFSLRGLADMFWWMGLVSFGFNSRNFNDHLLFAKSPSPSSSPEVIIHRECSVLSVRELIVSQTFHLTDSSRRPQLLILSGPHFSHL